MESPYILQLPMEILQHIAGFVDLETGILHMRLTCKELAAAAFDRFADEYIANLCCYALSPVRTKRIERITTTPHLCRKIRKITFTIDPLEHCKTMPLAAPKGQFREDALESVLRIYSESWLVAPGCPGLPWDFSNTYAIQNIMYNVKRFSTGAVCFDGIERSIMDLVLDRFCVKLLDDFLRAASRVGIEIHEMHMSDLLRLDDVEYSRLGEIGPLLPSLASVKSFRYRQNDALEYEDYDVSNADAVLQREVLDIIIRHMTSLEDFH